ncbi:hypothetical protein AAVH_18394 [Aphelenchoides avenae]|nr:hypothetical protein AAVH_18394 [Aphelenchus avenae]
MVHLVGCGYDFLGWAVTWISAVSITVQLYLVYLIVWHTPGTMRSYRPFLLLISFWDFLLTFLLGIALVPELLYPASCVVVNGPVRFLGYDVSLITLCIVIVVGLNGKFTQDCCMAYRFSWSSCGTID